MDACCGDIPISAITIVWVVQVWKEKNLEITSTTKAGPITSKGMYAGNSRLIGAR